MSAEEFGDLRGQKNGSTAFAEPRWFGLSPGTRDFAFLLFAVASLLGNLTPLIPGGFWPILYTIVPCIIWDFLMRDKEDGYFEHLSAVTFQNARPGSFTGSIRRVLSERWVRNGLTPSCYEQPEIEP